MEGHTGARSRWLIVCGALLIAVSTAHAQQRRIGEVLPDSTVRFRVGSSELNARSKATLDRLAVLLKRRIELSPVLLVGHADDRGTDETNLRLSKGRAEGVKAALIARGIRSSRLKTEGVGSREPLTGDVTEAARALNRRVEIWVTPRGPVARLGRIERRVQAREPAAAEWRSAMQNQALRRLSRVRTLEESSSEIVFPRDDTIRLGPNALAVIFGSPSTTRRSRQATANIELEEGSLFAALAAREGRVLDVQARSSRTRVRSKNARIDANPKRKQTTVAVYDGEAEVESEGKAVTVLRGYGTRVVDGKPPEKPRRLPAPPEWTATTPVYRLEGEPVQLAWRSSVPLAATEVQLGVGNDVRIERPVQLRTVAGSTTSAPVPPGMYVARLAGIDDRGLVGTAGAPRPLVVLPTPRYARSGEPVGRAAPDQPIELERPGVVRFFAPPSSVISILGKSSTAAVDIDLFRSRRVVAGVKAADGGPTRYLNFDVRVPAQRVEAVIGEAQAGPGGTINVPVDITVTDEAGRGVDGLDFRFAGVWQTSKRLRTSSSTASVLAPCDCSAPDDSELATPLGDGRYRGTITASAGATLPATVRFYADEGSRAVETELPASVVRDVARGRRATTSTKGPFIVARAGSWLGTEEDPVIGVGLGAGWRWALTNRLGLDTWALARWFRRDADDESLNVFPLTGRIALAYNPSKPQYYIGAGAGVRLGDVSARPVGEVFAGLLFPLASFDVDLEAGYTAVGSSDGIDELAGWGLRVGFRWHPNR